MPQTIHVKAGDTEPLEYTVNASGITNLDDVSSAAIYIRKRDGSSNHVDGATVTVSSSSDRELTFDPVGAKSPSGDALDAEGVYDAYTLITWSDGDTTRHPGKGFLTIVVEGNFE